jgi:hypothetical protein
MNDNKGFLSSIDAVLAITLVLICFLLFNFVIELPISSYSHESKDFKTSQDIMESLANKINFTDISTLEKIEFILKSNNNSKDSIDEVSSIIKVSFDELGLKNNYSFIETNNLNGKNILSSGNFDENDNLTIARRNVGNYSFVLYIW